VPFARAFAVVRQRGAAGGIMITASHNPYRWNGMKFKASYGSSALPLDRRASGEGTCHGARGRRARALPARPENIQSLDILSPISKPSRSLSIGTRIRAAKFRFVVDPMHGAARGLLRELMTRHGIDCDQIRGTRDPMFGGVNPEPIEPHVEALRRAVISGGYHAGLCADGDGDRIGAMDPRRHVHHAASDFLDLALAPGRQRAAFRATSRKHSLRRQ